MNGRAQGSHKGCAGEDRLHFFTGNPRQFDLVITDVTMPQFSGLDLVREVRKIRSDIPVMLCTGFSELVSEESTDMLGAREIVMKPILKTEMAGAIRRALGKRA